MVPKKKKNTSVNIKAAPQKKKKKQSYIQEPPILRTNCHIKNQVKFLIKRRITRRRIRHGPWVCEQSLVLGHLGEAAKVVERAVLLEADEHDLVDAAVDVEVDVAWGPLDAECVKAVGEVAAAELFGVCGSPVAVFFGGGTWVFVRGVDGLGWVD